MEATIEVGASDIALTSTCCQVYCVPDMLDIVHLLLEELFSVSGIVALEWKPLVTVPVIDSYTVHSLLRFLEVLNNNEDVQNVMANFAIPDFLIESYLCEQTGLLQRTKLQFEMIRPRLPVYELNVGGGTDAILL